MPSTPLEAGMRELCWAQDKVSFEALFILFVSFGGWAKFSRFIYLLFDVLVFRSLDKPIEHW